MLTDVGLRHLDPADHNVDWSFLSPGEQQRLVLARALLAEPSTLLLDEATSAVDSDSEIRLYGLLRTRLPGAAIVSVGHRASLIPLHDRVITLESAIAP